MEILGIIVIGACIAGFIIGVIELDEPIWHYLKRIKNVRTPKALQSHVRRIQKMEKDAKVALQAIQNLHETKKRLNEEFREIWDNEFRLLLPPPETPNRQAVRWKPYYGHEPLELYFSPSSGIRDERVVFPTSHTPVPVGAIKRMGEWWYGFNNLPGYPHRMMFQRVRMFHEVDENRFWAFLPTIRETPEGYVWEENKTKVLASNLKDAVKNIEIRIG